MGTCVNYEGPAGYGQHTKLANQIMIDLAQGIINTTKQIVQPSTTAKNTLDGFMEAQKIFQQGKKYYDALKAVHDLSLIHI